MTAIERIEDWIIEIRRWLLKTTIHVLSLPYHRQFGSFVEPNSSKVSLSASSEFRLIDVAQNPVFQDTRSVSLELPILTTFDGGTMFV